MTTAEYDVIVLGAGVAGENAADRAVQGGLTAVIVEPELVGGECSYWACVPSKALLRPAQAMRAAQRVKGAADAVTGPLDVDAVFERRDFFAAEWADAGQVEWLESAGIDLIRGAGRLSGEREVTVALGDGGARKLRARHAVVVATGSRAAMPRIAGLADAQPWTSREATSAPTAPTSLVIIGGGVVAAEMATAYAGFGTEVTMLARGGILTTMEPFAGDRVADSLRAMGVVIHENAETHSVNREGDTVTVTLVDGRTIEAEELLVATGREPRTSDIGLETVGLTPGEWIATDDTMRVQGNHWLYAVGDVTHRALLTHQGKYQARAAGDVIAARAAGTAIDDQPWGRHVATADHVAVPQVTFTEPEVASVGLTAHTARAAGLTVEVIDYDLGAVSGASLREDHYEGAARMVVDRERSVIVGATFVGADVAELLHAATTAIVGEIPLSRLWHAVPAFPTMSEVWLRLLEGYGRDSAQSV
ncbi:dihydrolipoyl dehydrogenase family protein [Salinibacterium hongtaonis]|uniref:dihydrolipoyl dehydrogenase family protein n=1 Tax=Homoserinimonas hongtaonis TaxID=2079791 RepID=UPI000D3B320F|nr:NAD(P)/FAD-dependent oxidoreductase [Salinibacterium hongtaonis]AWB89538.1 pyridine nucleotide-disulfide oxidoreductase [Salinibacterium hongtaonis]